MNNYCIINSFAVNTIRLSPAEIDITETEISFSRHFRHWLHRKLQYRQRRVLLKNNNIFVLVMFGQRRSTSPKLVQLKAANMTAGLSLGLRPANGRRRYKVTPSLIGWAQT